MKTENKIIGVTLSPEILKLIEDGRQHYEPIDCFGGSVQFEKQQQKDKIKMEYCRDNNIPLIIIDEIKDVQDRISTGLKTNAAIIVSTLT